MSSFSESYSKISMLIMVNPKCKRVVISLVILFGNFATHYSQEMRQPPCPASLAKALINYTKLPNGSLIDEQLTYPPDLYWIDDSKNVTYGCVCSVSKACTRKCCETGKVLKDNMCVDSETINGSLSTLRPWNQELAPELWWITKLEDAFHIVESMVVCSEGLHRIILDPSYPEDMFVLQKNGTLKVGLTSYSPAEYCLDWMDYTMNFSAVLCIWVPTDATESAHPIGMLISIIFLLITFLVYAIVPDLHNLHGKTLMCHMASLIIGYIGLVIHKFDFGYLISNNVCISLGEYSPV